MDLDFDLQKHTIFEVLIGSRAYGTFTEMSDYDYRGAAIPPKKYFFAALSRFEQEVFKEGDRTIYDFRKFMALAADGNPNIVEILWVPESCIVHMTSWGEKLFANRHLFLFKRMALAFASYGFMHLSEIKTNLDWLRNPVAQKPVRADFGLSEKSTLPDALKKFVKMTSLSAFDGTLKPAVEEEWNKERKYMLATDKWTRYQRWRQVRNPKRAEMEAKFGFDTKSAAHLVRLMRMSQELLLSGQVNVARSDAQELLAIRYGAWSCDQLIEWATHQDAQIKAMYQQCSLPEEADKEAIERLCIEIVEDFLKNH